jgi:DNA repair photolyase
MTSEEMVDAVFIKRYSMGNGKRGKQKRYRPQDGKIRLHPDFRCHDLARGAPFFCGIMPGMEEQANLSPQPIHGRGTSFNPANRFESISYQPDPDYDPREDPALTTRFFKDTSKTIISRNKSPDVGFETSLNPYRGCEHGCVYCFARPFHEYLGLSSGLDFESKIFVKEDAPDLLRRELGHQKWDPQVLVMSGVTDPYQPIERSLQITRRCLAVLLEFRNPVAIITKNRLVTRDIDLLKPMAQYRGCVVNVSVTTLDAKLASLMEPRASQPQDRIKAIEQLSQAGIPVRVMTAPMIPGLNDHELPAILEKAAKAGARCAAYVVVRLPYAVSDLFQDWLSQHFPQRKEKILNRLRSMRNGKLYDADWGTRMSAEGPYAKSMETLFDVYCKKYGLNKEPIEISSAAFENPDQKQYQLFSY